VSVAAWEPVIGQRAIGSRPDIEFALPRFARIDIQMPMSATVYAAHLFGRACNDVGMAKMQTCETFSGGSTDTGKLSSDRPNPDSMSFFQQGG
jgi:hypothetical protein